MNPHLDDTFVHFFAGTLVDTGHPDSWDELRESIDVEAVDRVLLTSRDVHAIGNVSRFSNADVYAFSSDDSFRIDPELTNQPGMSHLIDLLFLDFLEYEPQNCVSISEGDEVAWGDFRFDAISFPVPDRSGLLWHDPDHQISFVGGIPAGRLPVWCSDANDLGIAHQRLDAVDLGRVYSRVDPPEDDAAWFKKRAQRFFDHFSSTLLEKRKSTQLLEFLEADFGGEVEDEIEWAVACLRYAPFF